MTNLVAWVTAHLDELEAAARGAAEEASLSGQSGEFWVADRNKVKAPGGTISWGTGERFDTLHEHIALNDPRSTLCRVAAERKMELFDAAIMATLVMQLAQRKNAPEAIDPR